MRQGLASLAGSFVSQLIPGPIGQGLGAVVSALIGGHHKKVHVHVDNDYLNVRFPREESYGYGANPASAGLGGRGVYSGAGGGTIRHIVEFTGQFKDVIRHVSSQALGTERYRLAN